MEHIWVFFLAGVCSAISVVACTFWAGIPILLHRAITGGLHIPRRKWISLESIPGVVSATTIQGFIDSVSDEGKRSDFNSILTAMRRILLDIEKHPAAYPQESIHLSDMMSLQLTTAIAASPSQHTAEMLKFRDLESKHISEELQRILSSRKGGSAYD